MKKFSPPLNRKRKAVEGEFKLAEDLKLLQKLREYYGLDEVKGLETWLNLSLFLARDCVPAFQHSQQGNKRNTALETELLRAIVPVMMEHDCDPVEACKILDQKSVFDGRHYYEKYKYLRKSRKDFDLKLQNVNKTSGE